MFSAIGLATMTEGLDIVSLSIILPHLKTLMSLAPHQVGMLAAASTFGITICSLPIGYLADRLGRKRMLMIGFAVCSVFTLLSGLCPNYTTLLVCRFLSGAGMAAVFVMPYTLVAEMVPGNRRGSVIILAECFLGLGYLLAPLMGIILFGAFQPALAWRLDLLASGMPVIFILFLGRNVPESPRWLIRAGRLDEAELIIGKFEHGHPIDVPVRRSGDFADADRPLPVSKRLSLRATLSIMTSRRLLAHWVSLGSGTFGIFAVFFVAISYLPTLFINRGISFSHSLVYTLIATSFQIPGKIVLSLLSDRIGRKLQFLVCVICASASLVLFITLTDRVSTIVFSTLFLFFIAGSAPSYKIWYAEIFPTEIRTTGQSFVEAFFGRFLGGVVWISAFPLISQQFGQTNTLIFLTVVLILTSLPPIFFVPETCARPSKPVVPDFLTQEGGVEFKQ
ncbi:MFS transporter [Paraburkholderia aspalathi]|uniref:MFS transporter n=1 Tax=Paraburkholderia aspalathi TaxID=1324617 RepID=UPI001BABA059|nr:MFS transporter [Paraburkholderia aspalathi]